MKLIQASVEAMTPMDKELLLRIERAARTCYKSEDLINDTSAERMLRNLIARGHDAMLEFADVTLKFYCDRGVTHEVVRHRLASYAQESTRYCNYSKDKFDRAVTYVDLRPGILIEEKITSPEVIRAILQEWADACADAERHYMRMIELGASPQIARSVLNNSTKTEICVKMNIREWRHFIHLRNSPAAHPQMREIADKVFHLFLDNVPIFVEDLAEAS